MVYVISALGTIHAFSLKLSINSGTQLNPTLTGTRYITYCAVICVCLTPLEKNESA